MSNKNALKFILRTSLIGALYFVLTVVLTPISYGPIQVRIAEALTVLPYAFPEAILGTTIGCFLANLSSPFGPIDWVLGTLFTFISSVLTYLIGKMKWKKFFAPLPPIIFNGFGVSFYVVTLATLNTRLNFYEALRYSIEHFALKPYLFGVITIGLGEAISTYLIGLPLLKTLERRFKNEV